MDAPKERSPEEKMEDKRLAEKKNRPSKILKAIWLYLGGIIAVITIYYLLTGVDQGIDVIVQAGERFLSAFLSVLALISLSSFLWYSCRLLSYVKQERDDYIYGGKGGRSEVTVRYTENAIPTSWHKHFPRLIAFNCFVALQVGIFKLPNISWPGWVLGLFILGNFISYFLLDSWFESIQKKNENKKFRWSLLLPAGYFVVLATSSLCSLGRIHGDIWTDPSRYFLWLHILAMVVFLCQLIFLVLITWRRVLLDKRETGSSAKNGMFAKWLGWMRVNPRYIPVETSYFRIFGYVFLVGFVLYILAISSIPWASGMGPLAFIFLALGVLTALANFVSAWSTNLSINLFVLLFVVAWLAGYIMDPYEVRLLPLPDQRREIFEDRPTPKDFVNNWFQHRKENITKSTYPYPVYIILSNGGASRAGAWSSSVLSHLQDQSYNYDPKDQFKDHMLCLAGASGGTVGNSAFYSMLLADRAGKIASNKYEDHARNFFHSDFLTYTLAHFLGPDLFRHVLPTAGLGGNRATALEKVITYGSREATIGEYFDKPMSEVFDAKGELPVFFINTTEVETGMPAVISAVKLDTSWMRRDVLKLVDKAGLENSKSGDIRLSSAAILSSRFPYVSPAGKVYDRYFVDGGYFDNSGAGTVFEFLMVLRRYLDSRPGLEDSIKLSIVQITNSEQLESPKENIHPVINDIAAPLLTLAGMQGASTRIGTGVLKKYFVEAFAKSHPKFTLYSLYDRCWCQPSDCKDFVPPKRCGPDEECECEEGYPMSWVISDYQFSRMKKALTRESETNKGAFYFF